MITKLGNKIHNKLANVFKLPSSFPWTAEVNNLCPLIYFLCDSAVSPESILKTTNPAGNYMFKVNNRNTRTRFEICLKLTRKTLERRY